MVHTFQCSRHGRWRVRVPALKLGGGLAQCHVVRSPCPDCEAEAVERRRRDGTPVGMRGLLVLSQPCICDHVDNKGNHK